MEYAAICIRRSVQKGPFLIGEGLSIETIRPCMKLRFFFTT